VVATIKTEIIQALNESFGAAQILSLIAAVLLAVLSAGSLAAFTPLITAIGAAIIDVGVTATQAAFTDAVWNRYRCNVFCHMNSDDSIDAAGFAAILAQITTYESGIAETVLYNIVNAAGYVGILNMLRSNKGDPDADCSGCCPTCADQFEIYAGTLISRTGNVIVASSVFTGGHHQINCTAQIAHGVDACCVIQSVTTVGYDNLIDWVACGETELRFGMVGPECVNTVLLFQDSGPFTATFTFQDC
jgi:hypothetical protein